jgi:hypothetical protein
MGNIDGRRGEMVVQFVLTAALGGVLTFSYSTRLEDIKSQDYS